MSNEGIRIKDQFIKGVELGRVKGYYASAGFHVSSVTRTARCISVKIVYTFAESGVECCRYPGEIKISDEGVSFRWSGISPRQYYHLDTEHNDEIVKINSTAVKTWEDFRKAYGPKGE